MAIPEEVRYIDEEHILRVRFDDGRSFDYPTVHLRGYCPCARCQGHGGGPPKWIPVTSWRMATVDNVTPVGTYAMCIVWGDGHDTGIHTFASLLELGERLDRLCAHFVEIGKKNSELEIRFSQGVHC